MRAPYKTNLRPDAASVLDGTRESRPYDPRRAASERAAVVEECVAFVTAEAKRLDGVARDTKGVGYAASEGARWMRHLAERMRLDVGGNAPAKIAIAPDQRFVFRGDDGDFLGSVVVHVVSAESVEFSIFIDNDQIDRTISRREFERLATLFGWVLEAECAGAARETPRAPVEVERDGIPSTLRGSDLAGSDGRIGDADVVGRHDATQEPVEDDAQPLQPAVLETLAVITGNEEA